MFAETISKDILRSSSLRGGLPYPAGENRALWQNVSLKEKLIADADLALQES